MDLVVHTEASVGWGGQEIRTLTELRYLRSRGYATVLVAPPQSDISKAAKDDNFDVLNIPLKKTTQLWDFFRLRAFFAKHKPLVVATHSSIDSWVGLSAAKVAKVPLCLRYRHITSPAKNAPQNRFLYNKLADEVITTSDMISRQLIDELRIDPEKFHTIPTGIFPPSDLPDRDGARVALANELGLPANARFIGIVAIVRSWKGHRYLIEAFNKIAGEFNNHHLVIVGDGPMLPTLQNEDIPNSPFADRIHTVGHRSNVFDYFRAFDIAVLSSYKNEAIPQSIMQAMFSKTPVVASRFGGIPEIVTDRHTGRLVEPANAASLAEGLAEVLHHRDEASIWTENAHQMVVQKHTVEAMGSQVEAIFENYRYKVKASK